MATQTRRRPMKQEEQSSLYVWLLLAFVILVILLIVVAGYQNYYTVTEVVAYGSGSPERDSRDTSRMQPAPSEPPAKPTPPSEETYCACNAYHPWDGEESGEDVDEKRLKKAKADHGRLGD